MKFSIYLSVLVSVLLLSIASGRVRDFLTHNQLPSLGKCIPLSRFQQGATQLADRIMPKTIVGWQVYGGFSNCIYLGGQNTRGVEVLKIVFDKNTGNVLSFICVPTEDKPVKEITNRNPRKIADFWLRRLANAKSNSYRWVRDGQQGDTRYLSVWQGPNWFASVTVDTHTGQLIAMRFYS